MWTLLALLLLSRTAHAVGDCDGDTGYLDVDDDNDGYVVSEDCNDLDPSINPGVDVELCNGVDDNCDCVVDAWEVDGDGDGSLPCTGDCDDQDPSRYLGAPEEADEADDDCDGQVDEGTEFGDDDGDGFSESAPGQDENFEGDCDDDDAAVNPVAEDRDDPGDGVDNDCDTRVDEGNADHDQDADGYTPLQGDCDDGNDAVYPGAEEVVDGVDNDCDGVQPKVYGCGRNGSAATGVALLGLLRLLGWGRPKALQPRAAASPPRAGGRVLLWVLLAGLAPVSSQGGFADGGGLQDPVLRGLGPGGAGPRGAACRRRAHARPRMGDSSAPQSPGY